MLNKIYEWIETGFANFRNDAPAVGHTHQAPRDGHPRKRALESFEDDNNINQDGLIIKKSRMGDLIDTVKNAAEGVKNHSSSVATWMRNNVSPTLRNMLPPSSGLPPTEPLPSTSMWTGPPIVDRNSLNETFASPSTTLEWKTRTEWLRYEKSLLGSKVCRRQVCMSPTHREAPKTNGHSLHLPSSVTSKMHSSPRLGRPLNLRPHGTLSSSGVVGATSSSSSSSSVHEKSVPNKAMQSPTHSVQSGRSHRSRLCRTAEESIREEEKEVYRQLLTMVSGGQSLNLCNGSSHAIVRSHRDFTSFLSSSRRLLQLSSPPGSTAERTSDGPSSPLSPPSPRCLSSQGSSNLPSPTEASSTAGILSWSLDSDLVLSRATIPSPSALQDQSSQDTQSLAHDGDCVIIVHEEIGQKHDRPSVPCFQAELRIKELTSKHDSRARERRKKIEEQEALAALLLKQRLSDEGQRRPDVEVRVRVPLEKEVPLTLVTDVPKPLDEKPEFPTLTEAMEADVNKALRGGNPHEVLSEGFGLSLTRKDLQTLSNLNWLNDEVINFYMNLLVERSKGPNLPTVNTFNTFFYPKLCSSGYAAVRRWTKKMDIFAKDILLVPVHLGVHWCLAVVDFRIKTIMYFDSMGSNSKDTCHILLDYLQHESKDKKNKALETSGWTLICKARNEIPQQMNGSDCGMFTCKYADYITKDKRITFTQKHMPYFRKRMVWELVNHKLM